MTYNWNTMVEITVPTGTNGWLYSGEVIINGVKVRFPVGVPTSVPEPAAVLLKKMIELEQEENANTAKPQNHYVGDVTIPAGKTLTLEEGAMVNDMAGGLGGGSESAGGGVVYVTVTTSDEQIPIEDPELSSMFQLMIPVVDTSSSLDEIENMVKEGKNVIAKAHLSLIGGYVFLPIVAISDEGGITFCMYMSGASYLLSASPDGWTLMFGTKA